MDVIDYLKENNPNSIILDGLDSCIIGTQGSAEEMRAVYDSNKIINHFMNEMSYEDACEFYSFNVERAIPYMGIYAPLIIELF